MYKVLLTETLSLRNPKRKTHNNQEVGITLTSFYFYIMGKLKTKDEVIRDFKKVHGDRYRYDEMDYQGCMKHITIICPKHGRFRQKPNTHLSGCGCPSCYYDSLSINNPFIEQRRANLRYVASGVDFDLLTNDLIKKAKIIHGDKYDYSKTRYINNSTKFCIICPEHGEFWQTSIKHINRAQGCPKCYGKKNAERLKLDIEGFITKSNTVHSEKYDYSFIKEYVNNYTKLPIVCPIHGIFYQTPSLHIQGHGCPKCSSSKLEQEVEKSLKNEDGLLYISQYNPNWLGRQRIDFYVPRYNVAIECQGEQHFKPIEYFGGEESFKYNLERDERKRVLCNENGIKLLYFTNVKLNEYPYDVFTDINELLAEIKKGNA